MKINVRQRKITTSIDLQPGDLLFFPPPNNLYGWLERTLLKYSHVAMYYSTTGYGQPLIVESIARGLLIRSLYSYIGRTVVLKSPLDRNAGQQAAITAGELASDPNGWYDYFCIPRYVLPKLILAKIGKWLPKSWKVTTWLWERSYHRNNIYICSELIDQAYREAGDILIEIDSIPLPDDLFISEKLGAETVFTITKPELGV